MNEVLIISWIVALGTFLAGTGGLFVAFLNFKQGRKVSLETRFDKMQQDLFANEKATLDVTRILGEARVEISALKGQIERMTAIHATAVSGYENTVIKLQDEIEELKTENDELRGKVAIYEGAK